MNKGFVAEFDAYRHLGWYSCRRVESFTEINTGEAWVYGEVATRFCDDGVIIDDPRKVLAYAAEEAKKYRSAFPQCPPIGVGLITCGRTPFLMIGRKRAIKFAPVTSVFLSDHVTYHSDDLGVYEFVEFPHKKGGQG